MKDKTGELLTKNIAGVNRILPHKHKYAWDLFLKSCANNWMPTISMQEDIKQWKNNEITEDEKEYLLNAALGFLLEVSLWLVIIFCLMPLDILLTLSVASTSCVRRLKKVFTI